MIIFVPLATHLLAGKQEGKWECCTFSFVDDGGISVRNFLSFAFIMEERKDNQKYYVGEYFYFSFQGTLFFVTVDARRGQKK